MSNDRLVTASQVCPGPPPTRSSMARQKVANWSCSTMTPLGLPVEPEVWMT